MSNQMPAPTPERFNRRHLLRTLGGSAFGVAAASVLAACAAGSTAKPGGAAQPTQPAAPAAQPTQAGAPAAKPTTAAAPAAQPTTQAAPSTPQKVSIEYWQ